MRDEAIAPLAAQFFNLQFALLRVREAAKDWRLRDLLSPAIDELEQAEAHRQSAVNRIRDL